ncbi:MAG TPA: endonuclease domain-containing protein, partial [Burkholderiaceae bacterium]|nr:endonuclease domain-containing protein [Burkholderiaceae bacterium]
MGERAARTTLPPPVSRASRSSPQTSRHVQPDACAREATISPVPWQPLRARARRLRSESTDAERRLWYLLRAHRTFGWKFRRQHPIGTYIVDFVCFECRLVVEVDGSQHREAARYDSIRDRDLEARGF